MKREHEQMAALRPAARSAISLSLVAIILMGGVLRSYASIERWSAGANDNDWRSNRNWETIGGAGPDDDLIFASDYDIYSGGTPLRPNNDFPVNTRFRSITITNPGYNISGNQIFLTAGFDVSIGGYNTSATFNPGVILDANQTFRSGQNKFILNGAVNLNGHTLDVTGNGETVFNGTINGVGTLRLNSGRTIINGNAFNFGDTFLESNRLQVNGKLGRLSMQGGVLEGTGTLEDGIFSNFGSGGQISPGKGGNTRGTLISNGLVSLNAATTLHVDVQESFVNGQCDRLHVFDNNVDLNGARISVNVISPVAPGTQFIIIEQIGSGSITGQFVQGTFVTFGGQDFSITYTGNRVTLTAL